MSSRSGLRPLRALLLLCGFALLGDACLLDDYGVVAFDECNDPSKGSQQYFEGTMIPSFFEPHCSFCHWSDRSGLDRHGAPGPGVDDNGQPPLDLDSFAQATSRNAILWARVTSKDAPMPPMGRVPTPSEMEMLRVFLSCTEPPPEQPCGAPYDGLTTSLGGCPSGSTVAWPEVEPILGDHCGSCHSSGLSGDARNGAPDSRDFDNAALAGSGDVAYAWRRICELEMPDDDPGGLSVEDAGTLREWWACGAPP